MFFKEVNEFAIILFFNTEGAEGKELHGERQKPQSAQRNSPQRFAKGKGGLWFPALQFTFQKL